MVAIHRDIEFSDENYIQLTTQVVNDVLGQRLEENEEAESGKKNLKTERNAQLEKWREEARTRAGIYQRTSKEDLAFAYRYLLDTLDPAQRAHVLGGEKSSMHVMIEEYSYKLITALFTKANVTYAVFNYNKTDQGPYQYLDNLLCVMRNASTVINALLKEHWNKFFEETFKEDEHKFPESRYVHSGGNLILIIAGMLCYLHEHKESPYGTTILEQIRKTFNDHSVPNHRAFYTQLDAMMTEEFKSQLRDLTENISDLDFLFMSFKESKAHVGEPDNYIVSDMSTPELFQVNQLSAYLLRDILTKAHSSGHDPLIRYSKELLPFAGQFNQNWKPFRFFNMSGIKSETTKEMNNLQINGNKMASPEKNKRFSGYRQTSNLVNEVPMFLNRLKQGYQPFFNVVQGWKDRTFIMDYSTKYGECIDLSIGTRENILYRGKHDNFMAGRYYSLETIIHELEVINRGPPDDKTQKRMARLAFLYNIQSLNGINVLYEIIGYIITRN
jgi:hypothetical protein